MVTQCAGRAGRSTYKIDLLVADSPVPPSEGVSHGVWTGEI
ncbi:MAG: hypothetical protein R3A44_00035 [Caldilineaceae bacterium]